MATYKPQRKTENGAEDVKLPISAIEGLQDALNSLGAKITDLTGTTWTIPSGWTATAGYGVFFINGNITVTLASGSIKKNPVVAIRIGYSGVEAKVANYFSVTVNDAGATPMYANTSAFNITFTGGTDATNIDLINWLYANGTLQAQDEEEIDLSQYQTKTDENLETESKEIVGAINELNEKIGTGGGSAEPCLEMPQIRFTSANGYTDGETPNFYVDENNPLRLTVEIVGGALQVGDALQVCHRKRFNGSQANGYKRKYKLQRFAEYIVTEEDLNNKYLTVSVACGKGGTSPQVKHAFRGLFHDGMANNIAPLYLRIRRPKGDVQNNDSGQTVDAEFSNIVTIWKHSHRGYQTIRIQ